MAWTGYQFLLLAIFLMTSIGNYFIAMWQSVIEAKGEKGKKHLFHHPFVQAWLMFMAMSLNYFVFKIVQLYLILKKQSLDENRLTRGNRNFNYWLILIPTILDLIGTSLAMIGLTITFTFSYQMFFGTTIVFSAALSMFFLNRMFSLFEWSGMAFCVAGLYIIGLSDYRAVDSISSHDSLLVLIGNLMLCASNFLLAVQVIIEEKFLIGYDVPPLLLVGWEGIFGTIIFSILFVPLYFIIVNPPISKQYEMRLEDLPDALLQLLNCDLLIVSSILFVLSVALYNFSSLSLVKEWSATTRLVNGCLRIMVLWLIGIMIFEKHMSWQQIIGFISLLLGYNFYCNSNGLLRLYHELKRQDELHAYNNNHQTALEVISLANFA